MQRANADDFTCLGELRIKQDRLGEARRWLEQAVRLEPDNCLALLALAMLPLGIGSLNNGQPNALVAAKELERCLALTAGPGAGKTEMLAQRADFLLRTGACRYPKRILAISFKVDASKNAIER